MVLTTCFKHLFAVFAAATPILTFQIPLEEPSVATTLSSAQFYSFIDEVRRNGSIPGISVGVVRLGEDEQPVVQLGSWGRKTEDGDGHDLTVDTLFGLASCSKAFLATSLGMLMDDFAHGRNTTPLPTNVERFNYDTKVVDILPEESGWGLHDLYGDTWATKKATIRDVLGHVSGMPGSDYTYGPWDKPEDVVRRMSGLRTAYELREGWSYNNQMYMLGSYIVSLYAGKPYSEFAEERIFKPLGMLTTTFSPSKAQESGKLADTWTKDGRRIPFWFNDKMIPLKAGVGGILSSTEDMVKWLAVWLNQGVDPVSGVQLFPKSVYDDVTTAHWITRRTFGEGLIGYGMGWLQTSYGGFEIVYHTGAIPGFSAMTAFSPSNNLGVSILANADEKHSHILVILKRLMSDILGSAVPSLDALRDPSSVQTVEQPQDVKAPSLNIEAYVGKFHSFGFSNISLCSPNITSPTLYCRKTLLDFSRLDAMSTTSTSLYSTYPSVWATHVRLQHFSGDVFNITFTALFPHGYGQNTSAFETYETGSSGGWVEFDVRDGEVKGFSLVMDLNAVAARRRRSSSGELRDVADAWFERV